MTKVINPTLKAIKGFENHYAIDSNGNIHNIRTKTVKKLVPCPTTGYFKLQLWKANKYYSFFLHRLLADHFIDKLDGCDVVNHIDGNKKNNCLTNLEWTTHKGNLNHYRQNFHEYKWNVHLEYGVFLTDKEAAFVSGVSRRDFTGMMLGQRKNRTKFIRAVNLETKDIYPQGAIII